MANCYICGSENDLRKLVLKDSFTAHTRCRYPSSSSMCQRCFDCIEGKYKQCWYWHPTKDKWSKLWGRNWSWLIVKDENYSFPTFSTPPFEDGLLRVENLPTRENIREWLTNPPEPPFTICIAVSGQKHTYPFAVESNSRDTFPVLFEESLIYLNRERFTNILDIVESLLALGFNKTEISTGEYSQSKLLKTDLSLWRSHESKIEPIRKSEIFSLAMFVAKSSGLSPAGENSLVSLD